MLDTEARVPSHREDSGIVSRRVSIALPLTTSTTNPRSPLLMMTWHTPPRLSHSLLTSIPKRGTVELKAAEQEFGAYITLEHARQPRQATLVRQCGASEAARRERKLALQAEIQRIQRNEHA